MLTSKQRSQFNFELIKDKELREGLLNAQTAMEAYELLTK